MKKKILIPIIVSLIFVIGIVGFIIWNNKSVTIITLDINPSIEIKLSKNKKVEKIVALNKDAKNIINNNLRGKSLEYTLNIIVEKLIEKDYAHDGDLVDIILYSNGNESNDDIGGMLSRVFGDKNIPVNIITVKKITKEDKELANKYNVSPAKIAYIKTITKENNSIKMKDLVNKSVSEIKETKETGRYCDEGWILEGDFCLKEKERIEASTGKVCPRGYIEYNGKCYEEKNGIEGKNSVCREEFELKNGKCVKLSSYKPVGECANGVFNSEEDVCVEREYVTVGEEYCRDPGRTLYEHKCLATKPSINGGCLNGDMYYNGKCVNTRDDYYMSEWKCPDGTYNLRDTGYESKCYKDKKTLRPTYTCDEGFVLENNSCVRTEIINPEKEILCPGGYTKVDFNRCINMNNTIEFEEGFVCNMEHARVINNTCVVYEEIEAKHN